MAEKRAIFQEVSEKAAPIATGAIDSAHKGARGAIRLWMVVLFALVAVMIAVGGLTRLTDSGLSITEWDPVMGALPPMNDAAWQEAFEKYQTTSEFKDQNNWMTVADFKPIFWWEWGHRNLGRFIGLVWAAGFAAFFVTRSIPRGWTGRLLILGALGGVQGAIGWWMVHSGLQEGMLDVASYRLATHLGLAFGILGLLTWYILKLGRSESALLQARRLAEPKLFSMSTGLMHFALLQILLGAMVAGIDAGRSFPTWPLMGGQIVPPGAFDISPWWRNLFENPGLVQFIHRMSGYLLSIFAVVVWLRARRSPNDQTRFGFNAMLAVMVVQIVIGIVTVINAAPVGWGILHQVTAIALWVLVIRARFLAAYPLPQSVRGSI